MISGELPVLIITVVEVPVIMQECLRSKATEVACAMCKRDTRSLILAKLGAVYEKGKSHVTLLVPVADVLYVPLHDWRLLSRNILRQKRQGRHRVHELSSICILGVVVNSGNRRGEAISWRS